MPIVIPRDLPAFKKLQEEKIFVMPLVRAGTQDIRPLEIAILNLMPTKIETETQLLRLLGNTPLQVKITFIQTKSYIPTHVSEDHLSRFYKGIEEVKKEKFDGMIITGAPVETLEFEDVAYWKELTEIMDFCKSNVTSSIFICWGAQAALYYHYGINKHMIDNKLFGIFNYKATANVDMLLKGMNDIFTIPQSRHTSCDEEAILNHPELEVLATSAEAGVGITKSLDGSMFFLTGHSEYDRDTLNKEYTRDINKGLSIDKPLNYFDEDGIDGINMSWANTANLMFYNWLNYYLYQVTPYKKEDIGKFNAEDIRKQTYSLDKEIMEERV